LRDFLENNVIAWFIHTWYIRKRCPYVPEAGQSIHDLPSPPEGVRICVAADWATGTPQSIYVGEKMAELEPHYTIHMGDTYYSGTAPEHADNYGRKVGDRSDAWPRGSAGSFAAPGNHEMFSSGQAYMDMIRDPHRGFGIRLPDGKFSGQPAPFCCLRSSHWCILVLDTGYDSLYQQWWRRFFNRNPNDPRLELPPLLMEWLEKEVRLREENRGIIVLTHHQYISAFGDEVEFAGPARQLQSLLPAGREVIWINGHEHRFSVYGKYRRSPDHVTAWVRCIGNGGMVDEHTKKRVLIPEKAVNRNLLVYDRRVADTFHFDFAKPLDVGYNGFAAIRLRGDQAEIVYNAAYWNGSDWACAHHGPIITETWRADNQTGSIRQISLVDHTLGKNGSELEWIRDPPRF
jgi:hypothetical protein